MFSLLSLAHKLCPQFISPNTGERHTSTNDGRDQITALPNNLLSEIVSRLPIIDAIRTTTLSHGWSRIWHSVPLSLDHSQIRRAGENILDDLSNNAMVARVSSILSSQPGPFNSIHLTCSSMGSHNDALKSWFKAFADKHLKELAFLNLHYPNDIMVPTDLFCCKSLKRLYLGGVQLPANTGIIPCSHTFHELWEICLYRCILHEWDIENLLTCSPKVEKLSLVNSACGWPLRLHIRSHSLRCMLHWASSLEELAMVSTPCLERLILWRDDALHWSDCKKIKICSTPKLQVIGYLNPADHVLQIRDTVIKNDMKASAATVVPSVEVLAMTIRFGVHEEERMVPCFLKCFPSSIIARTQTTNEVNLEFWKDVGSIQCVRSSIKKVIFDDFSGEECDLHSSLSLHKMQISWKRFTSSLPRRIFLQGVLWGMVQVCASAKNAWNYQMASDLSLYDPFGYIVSAITTASCPSLIA
uniref:F-box domain-containing protein n=1 Tax=Oryza meridionalis TaxID=40149 RepID=A0A0E0C470_9ORYZ